MNFTKMKSGKIYDPSNAELTAMRRRAHRLCKEYNGLLEEEEQQRAEILRELLLSSGENLYLQGPIQFDYGRLTSFGADCYANFNLTVLDSCPVQIGNDVFFGPNCALVTPLHPMIAAERRIKRKADGTPYDDEYAAPITIGDGCWIASNVVICGGVTIGKNCVIGAGSVVVSDIPEGMFAAGNPCRVIRPITKEDSVYMKKSLF